MFSIRSYDEPRTMGDTLGHAVKLQQHLHDQFLAQSDFCDVTLTFCGVEVRAHWCVLVSCPYFESFYSSGMKRKTFDGKIHINVGKQTAVRTAITFLYTGTVQHPGLNAKDLGGIEDILEVADYLQIDDLKKACTQYLLSISVNTENCVQLCLLASLYDLDNYSDLFTYLCGHLPEIMNKDDILALTAESVKELIMDKTLNYVPVLEFYSFIVRWVEHDPEKRECEFEKLFCELDLKKLPNDFIESTVESCPLVLKNEKCKVHVLNVKMKHMTGLLSNTDTSDVILVVGGCGMGQLYSTFFAVPFLPIEDIIYSNHVYGYIISENRWTELAPLPFSMRRPIVTYCNSTYTMFVYDGSSNATIEDNVALIHKFDLVARRWTTIHMRLAEPFCSVTIEQLHIVGNEMCIIVSCKSADIRIANPKMWFYAFRVNNMDHCNKAIPICARTFKSEIKTCVVDNRYIAILCSKYVGKNGRQKNVGFFLYEVGKGYPYEYSRRIKFEPLMFAIKNDIYLTKQGCCRYMKFNIQSRRWSSAKEMLVPHPGTEPARSDYLHAVYKNELFVFGGKVGKTLLTSTCKYDLVEKDWKPIEDAPKACINSAVVTAKIPSHLIRCHIDCPHCHYTNARSLTSYEIDLPDDDDDDENDYEDDISYDDDDYGYSDFWDNDMEDDENDYFPDLDWL
ncbi:protein modification by small protein conjugation [Mactra antiquata]